MAQSFYATISPAGYPQFPDLVIVTPLSGFSPGDPPARPRPPHYPDQGLPGLPAYPDQGLPGWQPRPDQGLPGLPAYPDQGLPQPPLGSWGPNDPRPTHPIVLPDPLPPTLPSRPGFIIPPAGEPGSVTNPYPPGEVPPHVSTGFEKFYLVQPGVGVSGPYQMSPGGPGVPTMPPAVPGAATPTAAGSSKR